MKSVVFGVSGEYERFKDYITDEIVAYFDNNKAGQFTISGKRIESLEKISEYEFDRIIIAGWNRRYEMINKILEINPNYLWKLVLIRDLMCPSRFLDIYNMNIKKLIHKRYYVASPGNHMTGGVEALHQLVYAIRELGGEAWVAYYVYAKDLKNATPDEYKKYVNNYVVDFKDVLDDEHNVIIVPEINTDFLERFSKAEKWIWWLSVDNYLKYFTKEKIKAFFLASTHLCQSKYSEEFIKNAGVAPKDIYMLKEYISEAFMYREKKEKKNQVIYNPAKGELFIEKLIKAAPEIDFVPIINMTHIQVKEVLSESKVYIDFGNHPGRDRIPREAAMMGCVVITGIRGAAYNDEDILIPNIYKFDESDISKIIDKIKACLNEYDECTKDFDHYRDVIRNEKYTFLNQVKTIITL